MIPFRSEWSMIPYGPLWFPMVLYGKLWSYLVLCGTVWSSMVLYGPYVPVWSHMSRMVL